MAKLLDKTNILIINDFDYTQGGASKVAIDTANLLAENNENINIYFFSGKHDDSSNLNEKIIKICTNQGEALNDKNKIRGFINGIYNFKAKKQLKKLLKNLDNNNTIIHVHGWTKCLSSSVFDILFKMKFKVVLTIHDYFIACPNGGYFNYNKNEICHLKPLSLKCIKCNCDSRNYIFKLYRILRQFVQNKIVRLNDRLDNIITISDFSERILSSTLNKNTKIYRVYNPIDVEKNIKKSDYKNNQYFLYVGRISKEKGVDIFCKAISDLQLEGIVVGDGDQKMILEKQYPNIKFVGWKNRIEVKEYMQNSKALIFPSLLYETMGLTVIEAQMLGIPVIVNKKCAGSEFITKSSGYAYDDFEELKTAIKKVNKNSLSDIEFKYDLNYIESITKCYSDIMGVEFINEKNINNHGML